MEVVSISLMTRPLLISIHQAYKVSQCTPTRLTLSPLYSGPFGADPVDFTRLFLFIPSSLFFTYFPFRFLCSYSLCARFQIAQVCTLHNQLVGKEGNEQKKEKRDFIKNIDALVLFFHLCSPDLCVLRIMFACLRGQSNRKRKNAGQRFTRYYITRCSD